MTQKEVKRWGNPELILLWCFLPSRVEWEYRTSRWCSEIKIPALLGWRTSDILHEWTKTHKLGDSNDFIYCFLKHNYLFEAQKDRDLSFTGSPPHGPKTVRAEPGQSWGPRAPRRDWLQGACDQNIGIRSRARMPHFKLALYYIYIICINVCQFTF